MKKELIKFGKRPFVRNVLTVATGTAAAQAIALILSPIITRLYGPESFGLLGAFTAIMGIVTPIAALTYPIAIVLPKSDREAKGLVRLSLYISVMITVLASLVLICFNKQIVGLFQIDVIAPFLYLIPFVILFYGFRQTIEQWFIRTKQFRITAKVSFLQVLILNGSQVIIGLFNPVAAVLIISTTLGHALKALMLFIGAKKSNYKQMGESYEEKMTIIMLAKKYKDFPKFRAPQVLVNAITQSFPVLLLTSFFGPTAAGFYSISRTALSAPAVLIGQSVGDVFYPRISEAANNGEELRPLIKKATLILALIGIIPFGTVIICGPWLFSFVFGADWKEAGEYARWIAIWTFFMFINQPSVRALPLLSAQAFHLKFTVINLIIRASVLAAGYYFFNSDIISIALFGITGAILNIILVLITLHKSKNFDKSI